MSRPAGACSWTGVISGRCYGPVPPDSNSSRSARFVWAPKQPRASALGYAKSIFSIVSRSWQIVVASSRRPLVLFSRGTLDIFRAAKARTASASREKRYDARRPRVGINYVVANRVSREALYSGKRRRPPRAKITNGTCGSIISIKTRDSLSQNFITLDRRDAGLYCSRRSLEIFWADKLVSLMKGLFSVAWVKGARASDRSLCFTPPRNHRWPMPRGAGSLNTFPVTP